MFARVTQIVVEKQIEYKKLLEQAEEKFWQVANNENHSKEDELSQVYNRFIQAREMMSRHNENL